MKLKDVFLIVIVVVTWAALLGALAWQYREARQCEERGGVLVRSYIEGNVCLQVRR